MLGLIAWIYLLALVIVLATEINVVAHGACGRARCSPRSPTRAADPADERAYTGYADSEQHKGFEVIDVGFEPSTPGSREEPEQLDTSAPAG